MSALGEFTGEPGQAAPRGFRWWRVAPGGEIYSAWFDVPWDPSSNEATCALPVARLGRRAWAKRHDGGVPAPGCSCGFYALHRLPTQAGEHPDPDRPWLLDPEGWSGKGGSVVFGVAEAWGRVLLGTQGWRARFSRALALYVPSGSELWESDRLRLVSDRYGIPIMNSLESLAGEWAPEPVVVIPEAEPEGEPVAALPPVLHLVTDGQATAQAMGTPAAPERGIDRPGSTSPPRPDGEARGKAAVTPEASPPGGVPPARWPSQWPAVGPRLRPTLSPAEVARRTDRQIAALERMAGTGPKRILELGEGAGYRTSPLADRGHSVIAVAGDLSRVDLPGSFDVVHLGGFGTGSEEDQRGMLRQVARWLDPEGCVLVEVMTPWAWSLMAGASRARPEFPPGERGDWAFDADTSRIQMRLGPRWDGSVSAKDSVRCYAPADLRLLLQGTGFELSALEPFADDGYEPTARLEAATSYLARLTAASA